MHLRLCSDRLLATMAAASSLLIACFPLLFLVSTVHSATFTLTNNCDYTVWPGILSNVRTAALATTGFALQTGESRSVDAPSTWSGIVWGRTLCATDATTVKFSCATGDCGSGNVECSGSGAVPPATLAEFTLDGSGGKDFYDVSLVDGYNLPMLVVPQGGSGGNCSSTGCLMDLNGLCPSDLKVLAGGKSVACRSACEAYASPQYCCTGAYGNPNTCRPSSYAQFFKNACPRAYSYAYDDTTPTFTCAGANYDITFCPSTTTQKSAGACENPQAAALPLINDTSHKMVSLSGNKRCHSNSQKKKKVGHYACVVSGGVGAVGVLLIALVARVMWCSWVCNCALGSGNNQAIEVRQNHALDESKGEVALSLEPTGV